jgi:mannose-1-phosphate guanylyltransferase/mannose-6-phosphate isomerase
MTQIQPVIMSGGAGTRLWPLSTPENPKQFHALVTDKSMLHETLLRVSFGPNHLDIAPPIIICAQGHENKVLAECTKAGVTPAEIILEPVGRNTAAAIAIAALRVSETNPKANLLITPADHHIEDKAGFWAAVEKAVSPTVQDHIVTLGIQPTSPHTGYGYIKKGTRLGNDLYKVDRFVEKPDAETAESYLKDGSFFWNAGIFVCSANAMLEELNIHAPDVLNCADLSVKKAPTLDKIMLLPEAEFSKCPSISIDYAVMEKTDKAALVAPVDIGWSDVGDWDAVEKISHKMSILLCTNHI